MTLLAQLFGLKGAGTSNVINDVDELFLIPDGFLYATKNENGQPVVSTNPANDLYQELKQQFQEVGLIYSGFSVTKVPDYKGREAFKLHFDMVHPLGDNFEHDPEYKSNSKLRQGYPFKISIIQDSTSDVVNGFVGGTPANPDDAALYVISSATATPSTGSGYVNVKDVADYYDVPFAVILSPNYGTFTYAYNISSNQARVSVKINIVSKDDPDANGQTNRTETFVGPINSIANILETDDSSSEVAVPRSQTVNNNTYYLKDILTENNHSLESPLIRFTSNNGAQIVNGEVPGQTYTAVYSQSVAKIGQLNPVTVIESQPATNVAVALTNSQNVKLPTDWADNNVSLASGDVAVVDQTGQNVTSQAQAGTLVAGTYTTKLTEQGLAKLAAINPNLYIQRGAVADGQLTVNPYEARGNFNNQTVQTGLKLTQVTAKMKDQNAQGSITLPSGWTTTDGKIQIDLTSGDVKLVDAQGTDVTAQAEAGTLAAGDYQIELTEQGLNKLKQANPGVYINNNANKTLLPGTVQMISLKDGQIKNIDQLFGDVLTGVTVTLPTGNFQLTSPADWKLQDDGTYQLPISLHDVDILDESGKNLDDGSSDTLQGFSTGTYTLKLNAQGIKKLQASNLDILLTSTLIDDGALTITSLVLKINQYGVKKPYDPQNGYSAADTELLNTKTISLTGHEGVKGVNLATPDTQFAHLAVVAINNIDVALAGTNAVKAGLQPTSGKVLQSFAALDSGDPFSYTDATAELTPQDQASLVNYANGDVGINFYYDLPVDVPITYHDDTDKDNVPANKLTSNILQTLTPYVNEGSYTWNVTVPSGYQLATNQAATVDYSAADQGITVHLTHKTVTVTPNAPQKGVTKDDLNKDATFTVTYTGIGDDAKTPDQQQQTIAFQREATVDEVTGAVTYKPWEKVVSGAEFEPVTTPVVPGYTVAPDQALITPSQPESPDDDVNVTVTYRLNGSYTIDYPTGHGKDVKNDYTTKADNPTQVDGFAVSEIPGFTTVVTGATKQADGKTYLPNTPTTDAKVTYTANPATLTIKYVDDNAADPQDLSSHQNVFTGVTDEKYDLTGKTWDYSAAGYVLSGSALAMKGNYGVGNTEITVHLKHGTTTVTPDTPANQLPNGITNSDLHADSTFTVEYVGTPQPLENVVQTIPFERSVTVDDVTHKIVDTTAWEKNSTAEFKPVEAKLVPGYVANQPSVMADNVPAVGVHETKSISYTKNGSYTIDYPANHGTDTTTPYTTNPTNPTKVNGFEVLKVEGFTPVINGNDVQPGAEYAPVDPTQDVIVTYKANAQSFTVKYVDVNATNPQDLTSHTFILSGVTDGDYKGQLAGKVWNFANAGYELDTDKNATNPLNSLNGTFAAKNADVTVYLKHGQTVVTPTTAPDQLPQGVTEGDLHIQAKFTVKYTGTAENPIDHVQAIPFEQTVTVDDVTHKIINRSGWKKVVATDKFNPVATPVVPGYVADQDSVIAKDAPVAGGTELRTVHYTKNGSFTIDVPSGHGDDTTTGYTTKTDNPTKVDGFNVPEIAGFTPKVNGATKQANGSYLPVDPTKDATVTYTADQQSFAVTYQDVNTTNPQDLTSHTFTLTGVTDGSYVTDLADKAWNFTNAGYELDSAKNPLSELSGKFGAKNANVTVYLKHHQTVVDPSFVDQANLPQGVTEADLHQEATFTVKYVGTPKTIVNTVQTIPFERTVTVDDVTHQIVSTTPWVSEATPSFAGVGAIDVPGYVADQAVVTASQTPVAGSHETKTITYTKNGSYTITVPAGHGKNVTKDYTTNVDNPTQVDGFAVPEIAGFTPVVNGATKQADGKTYLPETPTTNAKVTYKADQQSFTVTYQDVNATKPQDLTSHTFTLTGVTDGSYATYLADKAWNFANAGYELDPDKNETNPLNGLNGTFGATNEDITVYLKHATKTVKPSNPKTGGTLINPNNPAGPKYPAGVDEAALNQQASFTVTYTGAGENTTNTQQVKFHRTATVDEVTGKVTYGAWTNADDQTDFANVPTPVKDGYVANVANVPAPTKPTVPGELPWVTVTYTKTGAYTIDVPTGHGEDVTKDYTTNVDNPTQVDSLKVPEIAGFTPVVTGATKQADGSYLPNDPTKDTSVTYTADAQSFTVTYVDDTTGKTLADHGFTLSGVTDKDYTTQLTDKAWNFANTGYELDPDKNATNPLTSLSGKFGAKNSDVTVYLKHATTTVEPNDPKSEGTLIDSTNPAGPKYPTGVDEAALNQVSEFTVTYTGAGEDTTNIQQVKFHRTATVDEVTGEVTYGDWTNADDQTIFNDVPTPVKDGYVANVANVPAPAKPSEPGALPTVTVTYIKTGSFTIDVPAGNGENITKDYTTNVDNPTQVDGFAVPEIPGFTPVVTGATKQSDGSYLPDNPAKDTTVTYTANEQSFNVTYVDITTGQTLTSHDFTLSGVTDGSYVDQLTKQVWNFANAGYELDAAKNATNPIDSLSGTFGATNDNVVVYLTHQYITVTPTSPKVSGDLIDPTNPNGPKYPVGVAENDLNQTATLTVKYVGTPEEIPAAEQMIAFTRIAMVDAVTGQVTYGQWNAEVAAFKPVVSPVIAGYVASRTIVEVATAPTPGEAVTIEVTYTPTDKPDQPNTPSDQPSHGDTPADKPGDTPVKPGEGETVTTKPDQPDTPSDQPSHEETPNVPMSDGLPTQPAVTNPVVKEGAVTPAKQVVTTSVKKSETTNPINQQRLPQTGQAPAETNFGVLGLLAATSLSLLGFKRRERH